MGERVHIEKKSGIGDMQGLINDQWRHQANQDFLTMVQTKPKWHFEGSRSNTRRACLV